MFCERCDKNPAWEVAELLGDFYARLCTECLNEWHEVALKTPEWAESDRLCVVENQIRTRAESGDKTASDAVPALCAAKNANRDAFRAVAKAWFAVKPKTS